LIRIVVLLWLVIVMEGCATRHVDHFYTLAVQPSGSRESRTVFAREVSLHIMLPSLIDRGELVLADRGEVAVLEHERWAAPLTDQLTATLGQDIEQRRADLIVGPNMDKPGLPQVKIFVEVVQFSARRGGAVSIETHWRVVDAGSGRVSLGRNVFTALAASQDYSDVASALSSCLGQLADRLVMELPAA
jgi:uncharacterized lipoprotein YmbA